MTADCQVIIPLLIRPAARPGMTGAVFRVLYRPPGVPLARPVYVTGAVAQGRLREGKATRVRLGGDVIEEVW